MRPHYEVRDALAQCILISAHTRGNRPAHGPNLASQRSGPAFHADQGLCLRRILYWTYAIIAFGVAFVPFWLTAIKELDLQNAFAPVTFLATLVMLWLCIAALGHTI